MFENYKRLYVYDAFKRGYHCHSILKGCQFDGIEIIRGFKLCLNGKFPVIVRDDNSIVYVEAFLVSDEMLKDVDKVQGEPFLYNRELVKGIGGKEGFIYVYRSNVFSLADLEVVKSGLWEDRELVNLNSVQACKYFLTHLNIKVQESIREREGNYVKTAC